MRWLFVAVLGVGVVLWLTLAWEYRPAATGSGPVSRQMMIAALATATEFGMFLAALLGVPLPAWLFAVIFAVGDAVAVGWLVLLRRFRRRESSGVA